MAPVISDIIQRELLMTDPYVPDEDPEKKVLKKDHEILEPIKVKLKMALVWIPEGPSEDQRELKAEKAIEIFKTEILAFEETGIAKFLEKGTMENRLDALGYIQYEYWRRMLDEATPKAIVRVANSEKTLKKHVLLKRVTAMALPSVLALLRQPLGASRP